MPCNKFGECAVGCGFICMTLYEFFLSKYCHENKQKFKLFRNTKQTSILLALNFYCFLAAFVVEN